MSLPTPNTRKEQYLNAIATGNSGGLPTPITREEEYLDAIAKSGGGSGDGDMKKSVYDSDLAVANAGGISAFVSDAISGKVDKVAGKGLSENDYSDSEKGKVAANTEAIEAMVNVNGCCNILDNNQPSETSDNITWTVNSDKTVTASSGGQSVSGLEHHEINHSYTLQPGTYKLSGGVDSNNYIELLETNYDYTGIIDTGNGYEFTVSSAHTYIVLLRSGNGVVNAEFKPMLYDARLTPTGYVPYAMTNRELTERVDDFSLIHDIILDTDLNSITKAGLYILGTGNTNAPDYESQWAGMLCCVDVNSGFQLICSRSGHMYWRWKFSGTWENWVYINHA